MNATTPQLEDVLTLARQLPVIDQARLVAQLAPTIVLALTIEHSTVSSSAFALHSRAAQLAINPDSALARVLAIANSGFWSPSDADIDRWREERLSDRYDV